VEVVALAYSLLALPSLSIPALQSVYQKVTLPRPECVNMICQLEARAIASESRVNACCFTRLVDAWRVGRVQGGKEGRESGIHV